MSRSASQTVSAASRVQPPAKTVSLCEELLLLVAEELVAPFDRRPQRLLARLGVAAALEQIEPLRETLEDLLRRRVRFVRAAASSTASGMLSSRRQSSATALVGSSRERAEKSSTASGSASGGTGYSISPRIRSSSREVTKSARFGTGLDERTELRRGLDHLLEVVEQQEQLPLPDVLGQSVLRPERLGDRLDDEPRVTQRSEPDPEDAALNSGTSSAAASIASRVFPDPPGPGQRHQSRAIRSSATTSATSRSRPTSATPAAADSCSRSSSAAETTRRRAGTATPARRSPSADAHPGRTPPPRPALGSPRESNTCPPWPALITRAARCTSRPTYFGGSTSGKPVCTPTRIRIGPASNPCIASATASTAAWAEREGVEERVPLVVHLVALEPRERLPHHPPMLTERLAIRVRPEFV